SGESLGGGPGLGPKVRGVVPRSGLERGETGAGRLRRVGARRGVGGRAGGPPARGATDLSRQGDHMARLTKMPPIQEDIHACTMCGYCVPVCPAYQEAGWEGASPRGRIFALRQYEMRGPLDLLLRRQVKPGEDFARNTWECTGCGACEEVCPVDIPFDTVWDDVKAWMVNSGYERKELEPYLANVRETHNLFG